MITIQPETNDKVLVIKASDKLTSEDYETVFIPKLDKMLAEHGKITVVVSIDSSFKGWDLGAAWDDTKFGIKHRNDFKKLALVGMPHWIEWATKLEAHFISGEVKCFDTNELKEAITWAKEGA